MAKTALQLIADTVAKKHKITVKEAEKFVSAMFDVMNEGLKTDKLVKVKGLGTFKVQAVKPRESVNVNTGERVLIEGHDKVSFTPDATMKELVNKPFAQFETVVLNDGVDFTDIDSKYENEATFENADETTVSTNNAAIPDTKVVSLNEEETTDSTNETDWYGCYRCYKSSWWRNRNKSGYATRYGTQHGRFTTVISFYQYPTNDADSSRHLSRQHRIGRQRTSPKSRTGIKAEPTEP